MRLYINRGPISHLRGAPFSFEIKPSRLVGGRGEIPSLTVERIGGRGRSAERIRMAFYEERLDRLLHAARSGRHSGRAAG